MSSTDESDDSDEYFECFRCEKSNRCLYRCYTVDLEKTDHLMCKQCVGVKGGKLINNKRMCKACAFKCPKCQEYNSLDFCINDECNNSSKS